MPKDYSVDIPTKDDVPAILRLWEEQYTYHQEIDPIFYVKFTEGLREKSRKYLERIIEGGKEQILVAKEGGVILGFITFGTDHDDYSDARIVDFGVLKELLVTKEARSRGIGQKLMQEAEMTLKNLGLKDVMIQCSAFNPRTLRIYEEAGYITRQKLLYKKI